MSEVKEAGPYLNQYAIEHKQQIEMMYLKYQTNYIEIFYKNKDGTETAYNYYKTPNQLCSGTSNQLIFEGNPSRISDKRYMLFNVMYYTKIKLYPEMPEEKIFYFKNNSCVGVQFNKVAINMNDKQNGYFQELTIFAPRTLIFFPNTTIYMLVHKKPFKIFVLYVYSNSSDPTINPHNFAYMNERLTFNNDWIYTTMLLDNETYLYFGSDEKGYNVVITDNLVNLYHYVDPKLNQWLYDKYMYNH